MNTYPQIDLNVLADRYANPIHSQQRKLELALCSLRERDADAAAASFAALARDIEQHGVSTGGRWPAGACAE